MGVLPPCMSTYHMSAWCASRLEEGVRFPKAGETDGCGLPCVYRESNLSPL